MKKPLVKPQVYDHRNLSEYLTAVYEYRKRAEYGFSYEKWAEEMSIKSRSYLRQVALGKKIPAATLLPSLLKGLSLNSEETNYFVALFNQVIAPTPEIKAIYNKEIFKTWTRKIQEVQIQDLTQFLADPMIAHLFTYLSFDDSPSDLAQWSQDLNCDQERIERALKILIWQNLVEGKMDDDGQVMYRTTSPYFTIPSGASQHIRQFHMEGIKQAQASFDGPKEHRKMWSGFVALSEVQHAKAVEIINEFNQQLVAIFNETTIDGKKLYRFNQQLLTISQEVSLVAAKSVK
jgi:uncharacterized protein (TIGR02147 family)